MSGIWLILTAAALNVGALTCIKLGSSGLVLSGRQLAVQLPALAWLVVGLLCYVLAFAATIRIMSHLPFQVAVPAFVGTQFVLTLLLAATVFGEQISLVAVAGIVLIGAGVALLMMGQSTW